MSEPSNNGRGGGSFVGFLAFCVTMFAAALYLVSFVLSFWDIRAEVIDTMFRVATVLLICTVSIIGWRFVKSRSAVWKAIYLLVLLAVVASVAVPIALQYLAAPQPAQ